MLHLLTDPFRVVFMQRALLELILLALVSGPCSVFVLLRRRAFMAEALTHTVFPGIAVAFFLGQSLLLGACVAAIASVLLLGVGWRDGRVDHDGFLVVIISAFFAVGVVVVSRGHSFASDLTALLFGKILAVNRAELVATFVIACVVVGLLVVVGKELIAVAFDPVVAVAWGLPVRFLDVVLNVVIALVVVASLKAVGTALVVALVVVPGAIARLCSARIGWMMVIATVSAAVCSWIGLAASYDASLHHGIRLAAGATVVVLLTMTFAMVAAVTAVMRVRDATP